MTTTDFSSESVLLTVRKHPSILVQEFVAAFVIGIVPFLFLGALSNAPYGFTSDLSFLRVIGALWLLVAWMAFSVLWTAFYLNVWTVSEKHIYAIEQTGLFSRTVRTIALENIREIDVRTEGALASYYGYGTIFVELTDEEGIEFTGVGEPLMVRSLILDQIERFTKLEKENETLVTTTKDQEKLIHLVGHEVKGYLTKSAGALAAIAEGDLGAVPQPVQQMAGNALEETRKGVDTVMNILHDTNAATGSLSVAQQHFDAKSAVFSIAQSLKPAASAKGLAFNLFVGDGVYAIQGDEAKLRDQVFRNLIDNSIRYTPSGSIRMDLSREGAVIRFEIQDTGVGITPADRMKLFTQGGHGANSTAVNPESTGFGLAIAKQVVEAHGGRIWAESAGVGLGSRFIVELPA